MSKKAREPLKSKLKPVQTNHSMLRISELRNCVERYLRDGGHSMCAWHISEPTDSCVSSRVPVLEVSFKSLSPIIQYDITVREGYELRGGQEYGSREVAALVYADKNDMLHGEYVHDESQLVAYLSDRIPIGVQLTELIREAEARKAAAKARMDELVALTASVETCIPDAAIDQLVQSVYEQARSKNFPLESFPMLKSCLANEIDSRIRRKLFEAFSKI